jgi:O-antigen ligase
MPLAKSRSASKTVRSDQQNIWFRYSAFAFQMGLVFVTFEEVRPFGVMLSDYCFFLSLIFLPKSRLFKSTGSGVLFAASLILCGAIVSLHDSSVTAAADSLVRLFVLFGLIAPLALSHSRDIYKALFFLLGGIFLNCVVTVLQASVFPGIVDTLSINPPQPDVAFAGRFQGLTEFPVTLGLSAALGVLLGIGLFSIERRPLIRWGLGIAIVVCSIAALLSGSRTFLASMLPGVIVFVILQKRRRRGVIYAIAVLTVLWSSVTYLAPGVVSQYSGRVDSVGLVDYARLASAAQAALEISEKPLLGWGVDHFDEGGVIVIPETGEVAGAHNTFLRYWYASGLLGAAGFLTLFFVPARRMLLLLNGQIAAKSGDAIRLILACYVFFFIVTNLGPYLYNRYIYVPLFVFGGFAAHALDPMKVRKVAPSTVVPATAQHNETA